MIDYCYILLLYDVDNCAFLSVHRSCGLPSPSMEHFGSVLADARPTDQLWKLSRKSPCLPGKVRHPPEMKGSNRKKKTPCLVGNAAKSGGLITSTN